MIQFSSNDKSNFGNHELQHDPHWQSQIKKKNEKRALIDMVIGSIVYLLRDFLKFEPKVLVIYIIDYLIVTQWWQYDIFFQPQNQTSCCFSPCQTAPCVSLFPSRLGWEKSICQWLSGLSAHSRRSKIVSFTSGSPTGFRTFCSIYTQVISFPVPKISGKTEKYVKLKLFSREYSCCHFCKSKIVSLVSGSPTGFRTFTPRYITYFRSRLSRMMYLYPFPWNWIFDYPPCGASRALGALFFLRKVKPINDR